MSGYVVDSVVSPSSYMWLHWHKTHNWSIKSRIRYHCYYGLLSSIIDAERETKYSYRSFYNTSAAFILNFWLFDGFGCFCCNFSDVILTICINFCMTKSGDVRLAYCKPMCIHVSKRVCCKEETSSMCACMALMIASVCISYILEFRRSTLASF